MYQKVTIAGYLGRDPEMRYTQDGTPVTNFSVATSRKWKGADGSQSEETTWFRVSAWRRLAETCNEYLKKGSAVLIEGRLNPDENGNPKTYTKNDGSAGASFELTAQIVKFLGGGSGNGSTSEAPPVEDETEIPF